MNNPIPHPFKAGDAIFRIVERTRRMNDLALESGTVVRVGKRITVRTDSGTRCVTPRYVVYATHCPQCRHCGASSPQCPVCGSAIVQMPPPPATVVLRFSLGYARHDPLAVFYHEVARALLTGGTVGDAREVCWARQSEQDVEYVRDMMRRASALLCGDGLNLPPPWQPPADDQEPDSNTNDQITQWLRRQFAEKGGE